MQTASYYIMTIITLKYVNISTLILFDYFKTILKIFMHNLVLKNDVAKKYLKIKNLSNLIIKILKIVFVINLKKKEKHFTYTEIL